MTKLTALNPVLGVPSLETTDEGTYLNAEQLVTINEYLDGIQQAYEERNQAVNNHTQVLDSLDTIDPSIARAETPEAKVEAIRTMLAALDQDPIYDQVEAFVDGISQVYRGSRCRFSCPRPGGSITSEINATADTTSAPRTRMSMNRRE